MDAVEGVDYSDGRPRPAVLRALGKRFAVRYTSPGRNSKNITRSECVALWGARVWPVIVFESTRDRALAGYNAGVADARASLACAAWAGVPDGVVHYAAVDFSPTSVQLSLIESYVAGWRSVIGHDRLGLYGGLRLIAAASEGDWAAHLWQTYAWSGGLWHPDAGAHQYRNGVTIDGADVDLDRAMVDYIGQFGPRGPVYDWRDDDMTPLELLSYRVSGEGTGGKSMSVFELLEQGYIARGEIANLSGRFDNFAQTHPSGVDGTVTLTDADRAAIVADLRDALRQDIATAMGALGWGKDSPTMPAQPSGG